MLVLPNYRRVTVRGFRNGILMEFYPLAQKRPCQSFVQHMTLEKTAGFQI
jgi:hypothetical protein